MHAEIYLLSVMDMLEENPNTGTKLLKFFLSRNQLQCSSYSNYLPSKSSLSEIPAHVSPPGIASVNFPSMVPALLQAPEKSIVWEFVSLHG